MFIECQDKDFCFHSDSINLSFLFRYFSFSLNRHNKLLLKEKKKGEFLQCLLLSCVEDLVSKHTYLHFRVFGAKVLRSVPK